MKYVRLLIILQECLESTVEKEVQIVFLVENNT